MNESIAFAAGVVAYQSRLRAKLVLIERACGTVGSEGIAALDIRGRLVRFNRLCQRNDREAAEKVLDDIGVFTATGEGTRSLASALDRIRCER